MAAVDTTVAVPRDDLDDLFDYGVNDADDPFREFNANLNAPIQEDPSRTSKINKRGADLGIDTEIKVTKKRAPIAKLNEDRLLSQAGIPKLRRIARERFKFKGKGHEYSDVARLLNLYQLWLDDLYPRAKFADGLAMIEKLGHKKRLQTMRREWIDEGKPRDIFDDNTSKDTTVPKAPQLESKPDSLSLNQGRATQDADNSVGLDLCDLYSGTPEPPGGNRNVSNDNQGQKDALFLSDDDHDPQLQDDDMDELDALLAEDSLRESHSSTAANEQEQSTSNKAPTKDDDFDDEMEAMAGMDDMW